MASLSEADLVCAEVLVGKGRSVRGDAQFVTTQTGNFTVTRLTDG